MTDFNRLAATQNHYQGDTLKVLTVCSAGLLRSPTAAVILASDPWRFNTRACGTEDYALIQLSDPLIFWADEIVCMTELQTDKVKARIKDLEPLLGHGKDQVIHTLHIPDRFAYMDGELVELLKEKFSEIY